MGQQPLRNPTGDPKPSVAAHTPGPWHVSSEADGIWIDADGMPVCRIRAAGPPISTEIADATLIAAAPDMLEVCRDVIDAIYWGDGKEHPIIDRARKAIAKATGESL